ncbi:hypothetical protein EDB83DRAFT_2583893 [Lactarius deliciosus]|nr:hypothetical protein EDB83DRAFT_2583893 [Lactarius deliciosus]
MSDVVNHESVEFLASRETRITVHDYSVHQTESQIRVLEDVVNLEPVPAPAVWYLDSTDGILQNRYCRWVGAAIAVPFVIITVVGVRMACVQSRRGCEVHRSHAIVVVVGTRGRGPTRQVTTLEGGSIIAVGDARGWRQQRKVPRRSTRRRCRYRRRMEAALELDLLVVVNHPARPASRPQATKTKTILDDDNDEWAATEGTRRPARPRSPSATGPPIATCTPDDDNTGCDGHSALAGLACTTNGNSDGNGSGPLPCAPPTTATTTTRVATEGTSPQHRPLALAQSPATCTPYDDDEGDTESPTPLQLPRTMRPYDDNSYGGSDGGKGYNNAAVAARDCAHPCDDGSGSDTTPLPLPRTPTRFDDDNSSNSDVEYLDSTVFFVAHNRFCFLIS